MGYPADPLDIRPPRVPDFIEPFIAWRVWDVALSDDGLTLESLFYPTNWTPGTKMKATCRYGCPEVPGRSHDHGDGVHSLPCGFYGGKTLEQAATYLPATLSDPTSMTLKRTRSVIGKVALAGLVKEHERGYRAELAWPVALWVPVSFGFPVNAWEGDPERAARLLYRRYDVPVKLFRRVRDLEDA